MASYPFSSSWSGSPAKAKFSGSVSSMRASADMGLNVTNDTVRSETSPATRLPGRIWACNSVPGSKFAPPGTSAFSSIMACSCVKVRTWYVPRPPRAPTARTTDDMGFCTPFRVKFQRCHGGKTGPTFVTMALVCQSYTSPELVSMKSVPLVPI